MSSTFLDISVALDTLLQDASGYSTAVFDESPYGGVYVAWPNKGFTPDITLVNVRPTNLQGDTVGITLGDDGNDETIGVYQIDIFGNAGDGKNTVLRLADYYAEVFKPTTILNYGNSSATVFRASIGTAVNEDAYYKINLDIRYRAFSLKR